VVLVVPETASPAKLEALESAGAGSSGGVTLVRHGETYEAAEDHAREVAASGRGVYVSAYSDWAVIAGQATVGEELAAVWPGGELTVVCPLGGGGLASGLALWAAGRPGARLAAAEAAASPGAGRSVTAGRVVHVDVGRTLADGLAGNLEVGSPTPGVLGDGVRAGRVTVVDVTEDELSSAVRWLFSRHGLVAEGAGAAGVAALLGGRVAPAGRTVAVVSGRNITAQRYRELLAG